MNYFFNFLVVTHLVSCFLPNNFDVEEINLHILSDNSFFSRQSIFKLSASPFLIPVYAKIRCLHVPCISIMNFLNESLFTTLYF